MEAEGINFETHVKVGETVSAKELLDKHDMLLLCMGSAWARDLPIPGKGFCKEFFSPKIRDYYGSGWVGPGVTRNFLLENRPKISLKQC